MELKEIRQLAKLMREMDLSSIEVSEGEKKLKLSRSVTEAHTTVNTGRITETESVAQVITAAAASTPQEETPLVDGKTVTAPMVGVFYAAPSPDADPYVTVGSQVKAGDVLCIIEAMKLMNEITAEKSGTIVEICVSDGEVVDFGHPLFRFK